MKMKMTFPTKGYGRIFCKNEEDKKKIKDIIQSMDDFEYTYLPDDLISSKVTLRVTENHETMADFPTVFVGKFDDLDLDELQMRCFLENIPILCYIGSGSYAEGDSYYYDKSIKL